MSEQIFTFFDILGTVAFAASGVLAGMRKRLDLFGLLIVAFVTAIGGGTLRDLLLGNTPVTWIRSVSYSGIITLTVFAVIPFTHLIKHLKKTLLIFDSVGLGFFTLLGLQKGLDFNLSIAICIVLGTITACFGGVIRDILINDIPLIFRKEIYASACILGALVYFLLKYFNVPQGWKEVACIMTVVIIRLLAVRYNWSLPNIYGQWGRKRSFKKRRPYRKD